MMTRPLITAVASVLALGMATAVQAQEQDFPAFPEPEQRAPSFPTGPSQDLQQQRAMMMAMRPLIELIGHVGALNELSKSGAVTFAPEQKPILTRLLTELRSQPIVNQRNAPTYLSRLRASLAPEQSDAVTAAVAERGQRMRQAMAAGGAGAQGGGSPSGAGGGMMMVGGPGVLPANPFAGEARPAQAIVELLERLDQS